ncbi:hypothetical protein F3Y22_tig00002744pilonHSYRG00005 [Hibiscus syriacus]|uniref:RNase H type-1 domain-containing protein n=1 Tax=Hibiscus syriacus TaxID=106335 RepID=A0A6A3CX52_HIBSY|nr:hypothetical protein F3Y22_tig00002744pilonHSYRG00005 [Hibiscus syriacus]
MTPGWQVTASSPALLASFDSARCFTSSNQTSSAAPKNSWCKPPNTAIKINVDAACSHSSRGSAIGVLPRDYHGLAVTCHTSPFARPCDVGLVEAAVITFGIRMAIDLQACIADVLVNDAVNDE